MICEQDVNADRDCDELNLGPVLPDLSLAPGAAHKKLAPAVGGEREVGGMKVGSGRLRRRSADDLVEHRHRD